MYPIGTYNDYLIVVADRVDSTMTIPDGDGVVHTYTCIGKSVYALIPFEDYLNSVENYIYFTDLTA